MHHYIGWSCSSLTHSFSYCLFYSVTHESRMHFDSLYTNGIQIFISLVVQNVESHHLCNHTCTYGNDVCLIPPSFLPVLPPLPHFPLQNPKFLHSALTNPHYVSASTYQRKHSSFGFGGLAYFT